MIPWTTLSYVHVKSSFLVDKGKIELCTSTDALHKDQSTWWSTIVNFLSSRHILLSPADQDEEITYSGVKITRCRQAPRADSLLNLDKSLHSTRGTSASWFWAKWPWSVTGRTPTIRVISMCSQTRRNRDRHPRNHLTEYLRCLKLESSCLSILAFTSVIVQ